MTDFIGIINSMSKSFQKEVETKNENEKINLNSDVTLKWRGLHRNQFASVRKKNNKSEIQNPSDFLLESRDFSGSATEIDIKTLTKNDEDFVNLPELVQNEILSKTPKIEEVFSEENKIPESDKTITQTSQNKKKQRKRKIPENNKTVTTRLRKQLKLLQTSQEPEIKTEIVDEPTEVKLKTKDKLKKINPLSSKMRKKISPKKRQAIPATQPIIKEPITIEITPKKRGRKPKNKDIITKLVEIKRSPRLLKTIETQIKPIEKQRLTRQIKPTAKILANEDLRQGIELNNILRLNSEKDERSEDSQQPKSPLETKKSKNKNLESLINFRTPPKQCPSPEEFLSDIKIFNIGINHQSPEVNKSLNKNQKRDLLKEKEKHLENLGLVRKVIVSSDSEQEETEPPAVKQKPIESEQMPSTSSQLNVIKEIEPEPICLCVKPSQYYVKKSTEEMQCSAIDQIEAEQIGCANLIDDESINLLRPSAKIGYMVLCKSHKRRLHSHNCCSGCGVFCTQGVFYVCSKDHFFHKDCANKFVLSTPYDLNLDLSSPTLILKCPHCGIDVPENQSKINLEMRSDKPLVFIPNHRSLLSLSKMSFSKLKKTITTSPESDWPEFQKLIPTSIHEILDKAQSLNISTNFTPKNFLLSVYKNDIQAVAVMIASNFDITTVFSEFFNGTCLHLVASYGNLTMAYLLISRAISQSYFNLTDNEIRTALMCAVLSNKDDILKMLIDFGGDVCVKGPKGMTVLHIAAKLGNRTAVEIILDRAVNTMSRVKFDKFLNCLDDANWSALFWAVKNGCKEIVSCLLQSGANVNLRDKQNNTVLHWAAVDNKIDLMTPIVQSKCIMNYQNVKGDTAFHIACRNSYASCCLILITFGADLYLKNNSNETAYECILDKGSDCARALHFNMEIRKLSSIPDTQIVCRDISNGREKNDIQAVCTRKHRTDLDEIKLPKFKYVTKSLIFENSFQIDGRQSQRSCSTCEDDCSSESCQCKEATMPNWYNDDGRLKTHLSFQNPAMIFECNDTCGCNKMTCKNRVVQNGISVPLQVFKCEGSNIGWGVRSLGKILKGTFIAEYIGELLTDLEADRRSDDSFFFDLGASEHCIDAKYFGNVSRFFNHSCDPNVVPMRVYYDNHDLRFPKIAFFSIRDIAVNEEITFDYGDKFWFVKSKFFSCECKSVLCKYACTVL